MPPLLLTDLPADVAQHILVRMTLAHHIARAAPTCKVVSVSARNGAVLRTFKHPTSCAALLNAGEGFFQPVNDVSSLALLPDGLRFVSGSADGIARIAYHGLAP